MSAYDDIVNRIAALRLKDEADADPECAHGDEDALMGDALRAIAGGDPAARRIAAAVVHHLETSTGTRWYS